MAIFSVIDFTVNFGTEEAGKLDCSSSILVFHSYYKENLQITYILFVVCFLLGNSPASEFYMSMFQNTQSVPSS